jgi:hypothetical protein
LAGGPVRAVERRAHPAHFRYRRGPWARQCRRRHHLPAEHRPRRDSRPGADPADRRGHRARDGRDRD